MSASALKVKISYCADCGYEEPTLALARALMLRFGHQLASVELIPWYEGSFDVTVGGELVHSMYRDGGFPDAESVVAAVRARLSAVSAEQATASVPLDGARR